MSGYENKQMYTREKNHGSGYANMRWLIHIHVYAFKWKSMQVCVNYVTCKYAKG